MQMTKIIGAMALVATAFTGVMASPAEAHWKRKNHYHGSNYDNDDYYERRGYRDRRDDRRYSYRGCDRGNGGTAIGAVAGGLIGNEVARRGDKTIGTILGAAVGAVAGRAIDKANDPCRRRR